MKPPNESNPKSLSLAVAERIKAVCVLFEESWKAGQRPQPEEFLGDVPAGEQEPLLRALLRLDIHYRRLHGETPTAGDYLPRFPGREELIRALLPGLTAPTAKEPAPPASPPSLLDEQTRPYTPVIPISAWPMPSPPNKGRMAEVQADSPAQLRERIRAAEQQQRSERRRRRRAQFLLALVVLAAGAGGAGGWWWWRGERARQAAQLREGADKTFSQVSEFVRQGRLAEAEALLAGSKSLVPQEAADLEERRRLLESELTLLRALDRVRNDLGLAGDGTRKAEVAAEYRKLFEAERLFGPGGTSEERGQRIAQGSGAAQVTAGLDDWAALEKDEAVRREVLALARQADPKSEPANQLRDPALWHDRGRLERLVEQGVVEKVSPYQALWLSHWLQGSGGDGTAVLRRAQRAHPRDFAINLALARALLETKPEEDLGHARAALSARPTSPAGHICLGELLARTQDPEGAIAAFQQAAQLDSRERLAHYHLGKTLLDLGRFGEARAASERCLDLLPDRHPLRSEAARHKAECERLAALEEKLGIVLQRPARPEDAADCVALVRTCVAQQRFARAAQLYSHALAGQPALAADLNTRHRSQAAGYAARAGTGAGRDAAGLSEFERSRWRQQALAWLQADLAAARKTYDDRIRTQHPLLRRILAGWLSDPQLAGLREETALGKLPDAERESWRRFWSLVRALVDQLVAGQWGRWRIEGTELVQDATDREAYFLFGDPSWTDCTIELEAQSVRGTEIGVALRAVSLDDISFAVLGGWGGSKHGVQTPGGATTSPGFIQTGRWYRIKVVVRGKTCSVFLDGASVADHTNLPLGSGRIGLRTWHSAVRFRDIKVTDPQGLVLFAGLPTPAPQPARMFFTGPTPPLRPTQIEPLDPAKLARRPSPADALRRQDIPEYLLPGLGNGDPKKAPAELVAVLGGESRFRLPGGATGLLDWSPDGKLLALPSVNRILLFDTQTGQLQRSLATGASNRVAFSPDGKLLAGASGAVLFLWDLTTEQRREIRMGNTVLAWNLHISPDGKLLAVACSDGTVRLWETGTGNPGPILRGHTQGVAGLAFHPDGKTLASASADGTVRLWDVASGTLQHTVHAANPPGPASPQRSVTFSPDGRLLASGSESALWVWKLSGEEGKTLQEVWTAASPSAGLLCFAADGKTLYSAGLGAPPLGRAHELRSWDPATGKERARKPLAGSSSWLWSRLSPDGRTLAVTAPGARSIRLLDLATGKPRFPEPAFQGAILTVQFSPDGRLLASGSLDGVGVLWDLATGKPLHVLRGHTGPLWSLAWSPDSRTLATAGEDRTARLWDTTGRMLRIITGHQGAVKDLAFSPDGRLLATAGQDGTARLWDPATGGQIAECWAQGAPIHGVAFRPNGLRLATWDEGDNLRFWDLSSGDQQLRPNIKNGGKLTYSPDGGLVRVLGGRSGAPGKSALHPAGRLLASADAGGSVHLQDLQEPGLRRGWQLFPPGLAVADLAFSPEGRYLATANPDGTISLLRLASPGQAIPLLVGPTLAQVHLFQGHTQALRCVALSPDGRRALSSGFDNTLRLWDVAGGQELRRFPGERNLCRSLVFSPDGRRALSADGDGGFRLWDVEEGKEIRSFEGHPTGCTCLAFAPDGKQCLSGGTDATLLLWDLETGKELRRFEGHTASVRGLAFAPGGKQAVSCSADHTIRLWDVETGKELRQFAGHTAEVSSVTFSRDGRLLVSGSSDETVRLWDVATGKELHSLKTASGIEAVAFLPDGRLVSAGDDSLLRLWDAQTGTELARRSDHHGGIWALAVARDGGQILTGGGDGTVRLWKIEEAKRVEPGK